MPQLLLGLACALSGISAAFFAFVPYAAVADAIFRGRGGAQYSDAVGTAILGGALTCILFALAVWLWLKLGRNDR